MSAGDAVVSCLALPAGEGLDQHLEAWRRLAAAALETNPFYEPALLLPALRELRRDAQVEVLLVFRRDSAAGSPRRLIGLFPLQRVSRYRGVPLVCLQLWKHMQSFLCTPLVDAEHASESLAGLFDWLRGPAGAPLVELGFTGGDGPWKRALEAFLRETRRHGAVADSFARAFFRPAADPKTYLEAALSRSKLREIQRLGRRLAENGALEYSELQPGDDPLPWIDAFLELEASGWKGRDGTALAVDPGERSFFREGAAALAADGRLWMLGLSLDGRWIALKCNFLAGRGGYAFKIAYDEKYSRFSPGVLLELETISRLHQRPAIDWMDSCAVTDHFMLNRLWTSRREITTWLIGSGAASGRLFVRALPYLQRARRLLTRLKQGASRAPQVETESAPAAGENPKRATHTASTGDAP